jgi:thioredoxin-like negative regulator of GroEL
MITQIKTIEEYETFTHQSGVVVAHFGFGFNAFDRMMQRNLIELVPEFSGKAIFAWVDVDKNALIELAAQINLVNTPTLIYFQNGEQAAIEIGMRPMDEVRRRINSILQSE